MWLLWNVPLKRHWQLFICDRIFFFKFTEEFILNLHFSGSTFILSSNSLQAETKSPRHGGESVAEVLRAHGVKYVFTLVGGHISPILVACEKVGIRIVDTRHEATAVFAADAVARLSGTDLC